MNKAVFLDRDGTINEDVGDFCSPEKLIFIPSAIEALKFLQSNFFLFIITNQSGVGKKIFTEEELIHFNMYFYSILKDNGIVLKEIYYCPHTKEQGCVCHKPNPYFMRKAEKDYSVDLESSFVVGDHPHDVEMAQAAGVSAIYVLTGHGKKHIKDLSVKPNFICNNLYEASVWVTKDLFCRSNNKEVY
jgi:D-glycero-D-manno-heptose 1,7-bisphosphate phosphatase